MAKRASNKSSGGSQESRIDLWKAIIIALITTTGGIVAGYLAMPHKATALEQIGLGNIALEGKWKYICTSFDGTYQHGGRFVVQKQKDGTLILNGDRMWRDTKDPASGIWTNKNFEKSDWLHWHTNWIFIRNDLEMYFEYQIPTDASDIKGYCSGIITKSNGKVESVSGNFYVLNDTKVLKGQISFTEVSDADFESTTTLPKNH